MDYATLITRIMPGVVAVLYAITAVAFFVKKDVPWGLVWLSYAMANVGLIFAEVSR